MKQLRDYPIDDAKYYERIWNNDEMFVVLSTETTDGLKHAVSLALKQQEDKTDGQ